MNQLPKDEQGTTPEHTPADTAEQAPKKDDASGKKGPLYSTTGESRRVQMAIFSHPQEPSGEVRYTTNICRRYKRSDGDWVSSSYYDHPHDLEEVIELATEALKRINRLKGLPPEAGDLTPGSV